MVEQKEISFNLIGRLSSNIINLRVDTHLTMSIILYFHAEYQNLMELCSKRLDLYIWIVLVLNSKLSEKVTISNFELAYFFSLLL